MLHPLDIAIVICGLVYIVICALLDDKPRPTGLNWFDVYPYLKVSKKARGRGDVNHAGKTRRQQAHR